MYSILVGGKQNARNLAERALASSAMWRRWQGRRDLMWQVRCRATKVRVVTAFPAKQKTPFMLPQGRFGRYETGRRRSGVKKIPRSENQRNTRQLETRSVVSGRIFARRKGDTGLKAKRPQPCGAGACEQCHVATLAGETRFEHATDGFGDRCSTVEPLP